DVKDIPETKENPTEKNESDASQKRALRPIAIADRFPDHIIPPPFLAVKTGERVLLIRAGDILALVKVLLDPHFLCRCLMSHLKQHRGELLVRLWQKHVSRLTMQPFDSACGIRRSSGVDA